MERVLATDKWPDSVEVELGGATRSYVAERVAVRVVRTNGITGTCMCSSCRWLIDRYDRHCRRCGARMVGTTYLEVDDA